MAASHAKHHDYHLVNPSPWPVTASISAFIMMIGAVIWMRSQADGAGVFGITGPWVFAVGIAGVIASAFVWWRPHAGRPAPLPLRHDPVHRL
jgi:cytochrome c oxidase subunit 3